MSKTVSKSHANQRSLADRMKAYEEVTTGTSLIEKLPIYARIDMRAGHSFCHGLTKPFDMNYVAAMQEATKYVVEKTGAKLGYCQSDEASFVWLDHTKIPFETRLFKLQSVLASMFTSAFLNYALGTQLKDRCLKMLPTFDCRVMNMPNLEEAANMILWRERDSIKNSITLLALEHFSNTQIHKKNGADKIQMLHDIGVFYFQLAEHLRNGAYFRRELYRKYLTAEEIEKYSKNKNSGILVEDDKSYVIRSRISQFKLGTELDKIQNKADVLFNDEQPILR